MTYKYDVFKKILRKPRLPENPHGDEGDRTLNPRLAKPVLSQLSYVPDARAKSRTWDLVVISDAL